MSEIQSNGYFEANTCAPKGTPWRKGSTINHLGSVRISMNKIFFRKPMIKFFFSQLLINNFFRDAPNNFFSWETNWLIFFSSLEGLYFFFSILPKPPPPRPLMVRPLWTVNVSSHGAGRTSLTQRLIHVDFMNNS